MEKRIGLDSAKLLLKRKLKKNCEKSLFVFMFCTYLSIIFERMRTINSRLVDRMISSDRLIKRLEANEEKKSFVGTGSISIKQPSWTQK